MRMTLRLPIRTPLPFYRAFTLSMGVGYARGSLLQYSKRMLRASVIVSTPIETLPKRGPHYLTVSLTATSYSPQSALADGRGP